MDSRDPPSKSNYVPSVRESQLLKMEVIKPIGIFGSVKKAIRFLNGTRKITAK